MSPNEAMHMLKDILILWTKDQGHYLNYKDSENKVGYFLIPHFLIDDNFFILLIFK